MIASNEDYYLFFQKQHLNVKIYAVSHHCGAPSFHWHNSAIFHLYVISRVKFSRIYSTVALVLPLSTVVSGVV